MDEEAIKPSNEAAEFEGTFTVTQVAPVTAEEELKPENVESDGTTDEPEPVIEIRRPLNTYQLEPSVEVRPQKIKSVAERVLKEHLKDMEGYNTTQTRDAAMRISATIRDELRRSGLDRYRIVCQVTIGESRDQDVAATFLCLWRHEFDHYATATYEGPGFFATAAVFVVYKQ
ncbi:hypothetical protein JTE90_006871 [Oedothorax gibbosus]|uniref:Uncharacterized protein n=1 Tax=Oedothorax gibbosus TaxID=931172 RepID=A0AAV6UKZ4_9ARAC|nr:hypothetical protein JTE90_006871 [Oedothorax gibbosus]